MTFKTCYLPDVYCPTEKEDCSSFSNPTSLYCLFPVMVSEILDGKSRLMHHLGFSNTNTKDNKKSTTFHRKPLKKSPSVNHHICIKLWKTWCLLACCLKTRTLLSVRIIANPLFTVPHWRVLCLLKILLIADRFDFSVTAGVLLLAFTSSNCFIFLPLLSKTEFPSPPAWTGRNDFFLCY